MRSRQRKNHYILFFLTKSVLTKDTKTDIRNCCSSHLYQQQQQQQDLIHPPSLHRRQPASLRLTPFLSSVPCGSQRWFSRLLQKPVFLVAKERNSMIFWCTRRQSTLLIINIYINHSFTHLFAKLFRAPVLAPLENFCSRSFFSSRPCVLQTGLGFTN